MSSKRLASNSVGTVPKNNRLSKVAKKHRPARVPNEILAETIQKGAIEEKCPGEDLCILRMEYGSPAWHVMSDWIADLDADPGVLAIFAPSANIVNTTITPPNGLVILNEANSIINHYAPFTANDFPNPAIPGPVAAPIMPINIRHAKIALNAVFERIQNIDDPNYPVLSNLPSGSYICNVLIQWANVAHTTAIYKP